MEAFVEICRVKPFGLGMMLCFGIFFIRRLTDGSNSKESNSTDELKFRNLAG